MNLGHQPAAQPRQAAEVDRDDEDEGDEVEIKKMGAKKAAKLEAKAERKAQREASLCHTRAIYVFGLFKLMLMLTLKCLG